MTLARYRMLGGFTKEEQITYYGSYMGLGTTPPLIPPAFMRTGDLVYVISAVGSGSLRNLAISNTGGQTWTTTKIRDGSVSGSTSIWISWATFNGTWTANPVFGIDGSLVAKGYIMHVFRAPKINAVWAVDQGPVHTGASIVSTTYTMTALANTKENTVSIFGLDAGITYVSTSGLNWYRTGATQYNITGSNAMTYFFAHNVQGYRYPPGTAASCSITTDSASTPAVSKVSFYFT